MKTLIIIIGLITFPIVALGQTSTPCKCKFGTIDEMAIFENKMAKLMQNAIISTDIRYIPIKLQVIRKSNGTTETNITDMLDAFNFALGNTNGIFSDAKIQFYIDGIAPNYIDDDTYYTFKDSYASDGFLKKYGSKTAINVLLPNSFAFGACGYADAWPSSYLISHYIVIPTLGGSCVKNNTLAHELGHYFALKHTHSGTVWDNYDGELVTRDVAKGANCVTVGDRVCDTPADPFALYRDAGINPTDFSDNYIGTLTDANGEKFTPMLNNVMSYWAKAQRNYGYVMTPLQHARMQYGYKVRTDPINEYNFSAPPTIVTAPSDCYVLKMSNNNNIPQIFWMDNSTNETGFIVERSTNPNDSFVGIGGVGPINGSGQMVSFIDNSIPVGTTTCYYRVKPSNTTTMYSNVGGFVVSDPCPYYSYTVGNITIPNTTVKYASFYRASNNLTANGLVALPLNILKANQFIELKTGFNTANGITLVASIGACDNPSSARQGIAEEPKQAVPTLEAYPNPTTDRVTINYEVSEAEAGSEVVVFLTTDMGKTIGTLVHDEHHEAGTFSINYSTQHLPEGMYIYSISTNGRLQSKRLVVAR
jgi:Secretion system C-terminal sorting domain